MSDLDPAPVPPTSPNAPPDADALERILLTLVPEAGKPVIWRDVTGAVHRAPPHAPIRVQALVAGVLSESAKVLSVDLTGGAAAILAAVADPEILAAVLRVFGLLHPRATDRARANVAADQDMLADVLAMAGKGSEAVLDTADLFPAEEIVDAIAPFCAGPLLRIVRLMR